MRPRFFLNALAGMTLQVAQVVCTGMLWLARCDVWRCLSSDHCIACRIHAQELGANMYALQDPGAGCVLLQVTSYKMAVNMESEVIGGPTAQGQPVFEWGSNWPDFEHRGMPNR